MKKEKEDFINLPKSESGLSVLCYYKNKEYVISNDPTKTKKAFTLWEIDKDTKPNKIATADSPLDLYSKLYSGYKHNMTNTNTFNGDYVYTDTFGNIYDSEGNLLKSIESKNV